MPQETFNDFKRLVSRSVNTNRRNQGSYFLVVPFCALFGTDGDPLVGTVPCVGCGDADAGILAGAVLAGDASVGDPSGLGASILVLICVKSSAYLFARAALDTKAKASAATILIVLMVVPFVG